MGIIEVLYIVFWVAGVIFFWRGPWAQPQSQWMWAPHGYYMLMFALAGLALFDGVLAHNVVR